MMHTVFLVDDEPFVIDSLRKIIEKMPDRFRVSGHAYTANSALEQILAAPPDVLITDIKMPGLSGLELIAKFCSTSPGTAVIVVSGFDDFAYVREAFILGAEDYVLKPVVPQKFIALLEQLEIKLDNRALPAKPEASPLAAEQVPVSFGHNRDARLIEQMRMYLAAHLEGNNAIQDVCRALMISQPVLSKICKKYLNCTYNEYLTQVKIDKAKQLLTGDDDLLIGTIAERIGYANQFYFSHVFKQVTGQTPSEYRSSHQDD